nr:cobalt ECF transporter T component CbiQ [Sporosalibacterium faouarense]
MIIDKYAYTNRLRSTNPMLKTYIGLTLLILAILTETFYIHIVIILTMASTVTVIARIPIKNYIKILFLPLTFAALSVIAILISFSKDDISYLWGFSISNIKVFITIESLRAARILFFRAFAALSSTLFIVLTTPMEQLIYVLKKHKIPRIFIEMSILIYRFIFIFLKESKEIYYAQELRFGYINLRNSYKSLSSLIVALFTRIMIRYEEMETALISKNFDKEFYL